MSGQLNSTQKLVDCRDKHLSVGGIEDAKVKRSSTSQSLQQIIRCMVKERTGKGNARSCYIQRCVAQVISN